MDRLWKNQSHEQLKFTQREKKWNDILYDPSFFIHVQFILFKRIPLKWRKTLSYKTWYIAVLSGLWKMKLFMRCIRMQSNFKALHYQFY